MADEQRRRRQDAQQGNQGAKSSTSQPQQQNQDPQNLPQTQQGGSQRPQQNQPGQPQQVQEEGQGVEEVRDELEERQSELEEKLEKLDEEEGDHRGDFVGEGTIIHEAQQVAYHHYGQTNPIDTDDYIGPVDLFFIIPEVFDLRYGEKFRRLIKLKHGEGIPILNKILPRLNRRMINYEYIYALKGIQRARKEDQISFRISDRARFNMYLRFPAIGPPLIFWPFFDTEQRKIDARKIAKRITEHGVTEEEVETKVELGTVQRRVQNLIQESKYYQQKIKTAQSPSEKQRFREKLQETKEKLNMAKHELRRAKKQQG